MKLSSKENHSNFIGTCWAKLFSLFFVLVHFPPTALSSDYSTKIKVAINWEKPVSTLKTNQTVDVEPTPVMRSGSSIRTAIFDSIKRLNTKYTRYHLWLSRPKLTVAELSPPKNSKTSWSFTLIDPEILAFFRATKGRDSVINFSTIPAWMFKTKYPVPFPADPNEVTYTYGHQGVDLLDPSGKQAADYFARIVSWYTGGGFTDELGEYHKSGYYYDIPWWEVLNEMEHRETPKQYTVLYDAIVSAIRKINRKTKFVAQLLPTEKFYEYFLNPKNHKPGINVDMVGSHFYAMPTNGQTIDEWQYTIFDQADGFFSKLSFIKAIRDRLSPSTKLAVNEYGIILPEELSPLGGGELDSSNISEDWWIMAASFDAYCYIKSSRIGIDVLGATYITGSPGNFPRLSLLNWNSGLPNARYYVVKLIADNFGPGDTLVETKLNVGPWPKPDISAQAFITRNGNKLLIVNKRAKSVHVDIRSGHKILNAAVLSRNGEVLSQKVKPSGFLLSPFSIAVVTFH